MRLKKWIFFYIMGSKSYLSSPLSLLCKGLNLRKTGEARTSYKIINNQSENY